jgi:hypothetical protein
MTSIAYGIAMPSLRGVLAPTAPGLPLDSISGVTLAAAWSVNRALLTSFGTGDLFRGRDTVTSDEADYAAPSAFVTALGGDAGALPKLYDQSGSGNHLLQATASQQPAFASDAGSSGNAAAALDNSDDYMATAANMAALFSVSSWYMAIVCYFNALAGTNAYPTLNQMLLGNEASGYIGAALKADGTFQCDVASGGHHVTNTSSGAVSALTPVLLEWRRQGGNNGLRVNGGSWVEAAGGDPPSLAQVLQLGRGYGASMPFNGYFFEGYVCDAEPAAADTVAAALKSYHGIA